MKVKIVSENHGRGKVYIDGEEQMNVRNVSVYLGVDSLTTVDVEYLVDEVEIELDEAKIERTEKHE